jgi:hypothetical protein
MYLSQQQQYERCDRRCQQQGKHHIHNKSCHKQAVILDQIPSLATEDSVLNFLSQQEIQRPSVKLHSNLDAVTQSATLVFDEMSSARLAVQKLNGLQVSLSGNEAPLSAKLDKQRKEYYGRKFKVASALILHYVEHVLLPQTPVEINVKCEYNRNDKFILILEGPNMDIVGNWISSQLLACRQLVITTDVDTEAKINLFRNITFNDSCAYETVVNNFDVLVYFVMDKKKCAMLKKYLYSYLRLDNSRVSERHVEIELVRKISDTPHNSGFSKRNRRNRNFWHKSRSNLFPNGRSSE